MVFGFRNFGCSDLFGEKSSLLEESSPEESSLELLFLRWEESSSLEESSLEDSSLELSFVYK